MTENLPTDLDANIDNMWRASQNQIPVVTIRCPDTGLGLQQDIGDLTRVPAKQRAVLERVARALVAPGGRVEYKLR